MKKFYFLLIAMSATVAAMSQTTSNWTGATSTDWQVAGNWDNGVPNTATEIAAFNLGSPITVTNVPIATIGGIVISGNTSVTISKPAAGGVNTLTISNTAAALDFSIEAGSSLALGNEVNITLANGVAGNPTTASIAGTFDMNDRTYNTNGTNVITNVGAAGVLEVNTGGAVTCATATKLVMANGSTYIHAQNGATVPDATWNSGSNCNITGVTTTIPGSLDQAFANFKWECAGQAANQLQLPGAGFSTSGLFSVVNTGTGGTGGGRLELGQAATTVASLSLSGGTLRIGSNTTRALTVSGIATISGGTLLMTSGTNIGTLNVAGNFTQSGGTITEAGTGSGAIVFNGTSAQVFSKATAPTAVISNAINVTINNNAIVNFGTSVLDGSAGTFTLSAGGKIMTANTNGLSATGSVQITASYNSGADYEFNGPTTGTFTTTPTAATVRDLAVNNTTGNVDLAQAMSVTRALVLTDGELNTSTTNLLSLIAGATSGSSSDASFVNGPVRKLFNNAETFIYPVGVSGTGDEPLTVAGITAAGYDFTAEYKRVSATSLSNSYNSPILNVSGCDHWTLDKNAGPATGVSVTLSWDANSGCNGGSFVTNPATLTIGHYNGSSWDQAGTGGSFTASSVTRTGVTVFSPFTLANTAVNQNPLPVMFSNVKAYQKNSGVQIEWSNLTERDLVNYVVERSANGQTYSAINQQSPRSNNNEKESYSAFDAAPFAGVNFYRIKVLEIGGKIIYSKILKVDLSGSTGFTLYPNPVRGGQLSVGLSGKQGQYIVKVINTAGQEVYSQRIAHQGGSMTQAVELPLAVKAGVYTMMISGDNYRDSKMFIVQ